MGYLYEALVSRGRFDPLSGTVVWEEFPAPYSWGGLNGPFAGTADGMPSEAIAAGLADVEAERGRRRRQGRPAATSDGPRP